MRTIFVCTLLMFGCGATAKAVEHAEYQCLQADLDSLEAKLDAFFADPEATAIELTTEELACAAKALGAKPPVTDAGSALKGPPSAGTLSTH